MSRKGNSNSQELLCIHETVVKVQNLECKIQYRMQHGAISGYCFFKKSALRDRVHCLLFAPEKSAASIQDVFANYLGSWAGTEGILRYVSSKS